MRRPIRTTFLVAGALVLAAMFPLLGLVAGCVIAGMGLHALLGSHRDADEHRLGHSGRDLFQAKRRNDRRGS